VKGTGREVGWGKINSGEKSSEKRNEDE